MTVAPRLRDRQRATSEAAILDAAWDRFARTGPDGASLRDVASDAGCTHALVARYYGSKEGLVDAIADRLATGAGRAIAGAEADATDPVLALLSAARRHRSCVQLLIRCALGDLRAPGFPACLHADWFLTSTRTRSTARGARADRRVRLCAYAAASLVLGWVTFEDFLVAATRLGRVGARRRDAAIAAASWQIMDLAGAAPPALAPRDLTGRAGPAESPTAAETSSRAALLRSAVELFAAAGPATVSVRDVARHADVNQGLIYRHFGSKDALLAEAIEQGSSGLFPAAQAAGGFDFDTMSQLMHHGSPAPRLIARTLVDDVDINAVRTQFTVLRSLLDALPPRPTGTAPVDLTDPRVAVAATAGMALGSVIWGDHLRRTLGLSTNDGIEAAVADLARHLITASAGAGRDQGGDP